MTWSPPLDDPSLRLDFHDAGTGRFREPDGAVLDPEVAQSGAWAAIDRDGDPVAAMVIDETLAEDPELVSAAAAATLLAIENGALEGELRASRARILEAGHAERRRIERDLHDSAQQRLIALRIRLALGREQIDGPGAARVLERLGDEVQEAIDELRDVARGVYPDVLAQAAASRTSPTAWRRPAGRCRSPRAPGTGRRSSPRFRPEPGRRRHA